MEWINILIGFSGGIIGGVILLKLQLHEERKKKGRDVLYHAYIELMGVHTKYWWCTTWEHHGDRQKLLNSEWEFKMERYKVLDELRKADDQKLTERILWVLFYDGYKSHRERYDEMTELLDEVGKEVSPNINQAFKKIDRKNRDIMVLEGMKLMKGSTPRRGKKRDRVTKINQSRDSGDRVALPTRRVSRPAFP